MELRQITEDYAVAPQILPEDIPAIVEAGFKSVMCNRPDHEEPGQCAYDDVARAAVEAGLEVRWIPIVSGMVTPQAMAEFEAALAEMPRPMLAYCRTGTRCTMLWTIAEFDRLGAEAVLQNTAAAGYDMAGLVSQLARQRG